MNTCINFPSLTGCSYCKVPLNDYSNLNKIKVNVLYHIIYKIMEKINTDLQNSHEIIDQEKSYILCNGNIVLQPKLYHSVANTKINKIITGKIVTEWIRDNVQSVELSYRTLQLSSLAYLYDIDNNGSNENHIDTITKHFLCLRYIINKVLY